MTGTHESILDFTDLMSVTLRGVDVQRFDARWDEVLLSIKETPRDHMLQKSVQDEDQELRAAEDNIGSV